MSPNRATQVSSLKREIGTVWGYPRWTQPWEPLAWLVTFGAHSGMFWMTEYWVPAAGWAGGRLC